MIPSIEENVLVLIDVWRVFCFSYNTTITSTEILYTRTHFLAMLVVRMIYFTSAFLEIFSILKVTIKKFKKEIHKQLSTTCTTFMNEFQVSPIRVERNSQTAQNNSTSTELRTSKIEKIWQNCRVHYYKVVINSSNNCSERFEIFTDCLKK